jgi:hypothetical protein
LELSIDRSDLCRKGRASAGRKHADGGGPHAKDSAGLGRGHVEQIYEDERSALRWGQGAEGAHHHITGLDGTELIGGLFPR